MPQTKTLKTLSVVLLAPPPNGSLWFQPEDVAGPPTKETLTKLDVGGTLFGILPNDHILLIPADKVDQLLT